MLTSRAGTVVSKTIFIVEDARPIANLLTAMLTEAGYNVVGTADTLAKAVAAISEAHVDIALLDVYLGDTLSYPIADYLVGQGIRFAFLTACEPDYIPPHLQIHPVIQKPIAFSYLLDTVELLLQ